MKKLRTSLYEGNNVALFKPAGWFCLFVFPDFGPTWDLVAEGIEVAQKS